LDEAVLKSLANCMDAEPSEVEVKIFTFMALFSAIKRFLFAIYFA
jgi:hypothetical protein